MDFDDQEDADDEIGLPVASGYNNLMSNNSSRVGATPGGAKLSSGGLSGGGGTEAAEGAATPTGTVNRRVSSGTGGGRYRECLKNHAVGVGGYAVDGCGEFMAAGEEGTLDALRCAACNCHRNFHRKETADRGNGAGVMPMEAAGYHPQFSPYYRTPAAYLHPHHHLSAAAVQQQHLRPHAPLALPSTSGGGGGHSSRDEQEDMSNPMMAMGFGGSGGLGIGMSAGMGVSGSGSGKKRFRTKFTQEQKDKMLAFAERVGWRIQKHDEATVQQFCNETGVKRHVLKVWMHNNKHTVGVSTGGRGV